MVEYRNPLIQNNRMWIIPIDGINNELIPDDAIWVYPVNYISKVSTPKQHKKKRTKWKNRNKK